MKLGITGKVALTVMVIVFISSSLLTIVSYRNSYQQILQAAGVELLGCANITTGLIDPIDLENALVGHKESLKKLETAINWTIHKKEIFETQYILTLDGTVLAADETLQSQGFSTGEKFFLEKKVVDMITTMKHGTYSEIYTFGGQNRLTGYAPIFKDHDPSKEVIAINAIDFDSSIVKERTWEMTKETILLGIILPLLATALTFIFVKSLIKPILTINHAVKKVATGDLTGQLDQHTNKKDEIGELAESFNIMKNGLKGIIEHVLENSGLVAATSQQLSANTHELEIGSKEIAHSLQQVSIGSIDQKEDIKVVDDKVTKINNEMYEIKNEVEKTAAISFTASQSANVGVEKVQLVISQMNLIDQQTEAIATNIISLRKQSNEISNILTLINDVAEQTNLLALNAAIEAARAGEHGKGFSIVAQEVRKLAEQTSSATEKIRDIIIQIQGEVVSTENTIEKGSLEVKKGKIIVEEMNHMFSNIVINTDDSSNNMAKVSNGISVLVAEMEQLRKNFAQIAYVSEANTDNTNKMVSATKQQTEMIAEISAAATGLAQMAEALQDIVEKFNVNG